MSEYALLYYPDFHPDSVWLRRVLLLSDSVTRIVPTDVELDDPDELHALQDSIPSCLRTISPEERDVSIEEQNLPRLTKAFAFLARSQRKGSKRKITMTISPGGSISIAGHVFLHPGKVSPVIQGELQRHGLILDGFGQGDFLAVDEGASHLILSAIAENISRRTGFDTITDKPIPFALNSLNNLGVGDVGPTDAEGALLSSLATVLIPVSVGSLEQNRYRLLRESYAPIRAAFKALTEELARINRLGRIEDPKALREQVEVATQDFVKQYQTFRKTRYARGFKGWAPLYIGGFLSMASVLVSPPIAVGIAGASLLTQVVQKKLEAPSDQAGRNRVFNMLAGLEKDIVKRSGVKQLI
jgi:hypothetical protein